MSRDKRCPITYEKIPSSENYSRHGLHLLSPQLNHLEPLPLNAEEQRSEALKRAGKMSVQGIQPKLSAQLKIKEGRFDIVSEGGRYLLKPQSAEWPLLPENEAITLSLAATVGIEVPVHGLVYSGDGSMTYFIQRFDRHGHKKKYPVEDFSQLLGRSRETKYAGSMEQVASVLSRFCTFPKVEYVKLFKLTLFNFLTGNEDMHLKNFSLITREGKVTLSPAYDLLNTTLVLSSAHEELALPLNGKKRNLNKKDFLDYFATGRLALPQPVITDVLKNIRNAMPQWRILIQNSFLSPLMQERYLHMIAERAEILGI